MRHVRSGSLIALTLALAASGCQPDGKCGSGASGDDTSCQGSSTGPDGTGNGNGNGDGTGNGDKATSFESDLTSGASGANGSKGGLATGNSSGEAADSAAAAPTAPGAQTASRSSAGADGAAERAIVEADIIQTQGDKLYALSRIAGLSVIDVSDPSALRLIGRFRELPATPFEMYLRDGVALVMFTGWGQYAEADDGTVSWVSTSKLLALDVRDSANITQLGTFDVPGEISDSRIVGDVLYIVGHESGYCWRCVQDKPRTSILSLNVADPRNVQKVDELFYNEDNQSWGQRSVTVTSERMYVAGPEYGQTEPTGSTIQVIDISNAAGDLVEGGTVTVQGQVNNRWQMDEYQGVLRVVSQPPQWWNGNGVVTTKPAIETFTIESSAKLTELGRADITIPQRDTLRSVRFDGFRGYAITAEQKDPLFTLDLSDPANPRQVGELKIPGFVYHMEPRGNRLVGLGFDQGNPAGGIAVSLFDVTNLATPVEITRVNFGGNWGSLPEDQNRIHKVFRVLDDAGLILVPYSGWSNADPIEDGACYVSSYSGGVQIIDFANDTLTARGSAASAGGETRRALLVDEALLSVADERVQAFDISDRDKPTPISQVVLSRNTQRAVQLDNDVVARISSDYSNGDYEVDFVASSDVEDPNRSYSTLSLTKLVTQDSSACEKSFSLEQTFVRGSTLEVLYTGYSYRQGANSNEIVRGLLVIDASDPAKPKLVSDVQWATDQWQPYYGFYSYGYYGYSSPVVRTEKALALMEETWESTPTTSIQKVRLRVVDLRDLNNVKTTVFPFQAVSQFSGLHADGDVVLTSHLEPTSQDGRRGKFYIDRFDIADPAAPKQLSKINVPGALMSFDSSSRRALTSEQVRVLVSGQVSAEDCYKRFANAEWNTDSQGNNVAVSVPARGGSASSSTPVDNPPPVLGTCIGFKQRLNLVHVLDDSAELDDRLELADDKQVFSFSKGDGVVFASVGRGGYYYPRGAIDCWGPCGGGSLQPTELLVLGGFAQGAFEEGYITVDDSQANNWYGFWGSPPVYAYGKRALLAGQGELVVIDATNAAEPQLVKRLPAIGSVQYAEVHEENALLTFGQQGVQWVDLRD